MSKKDIKELNVYRKMILNLSWLENSKLMDEIERKIERFNKIALIRYDISVKQTSYNGKEYNFIPIPHTFNSVIIDLEGENPIKMFGLLVRDKINSYMLAKGKVEQFYTCMNQLLYILKDVLIFGFSYWDLSAFLNMRDALVDIYGHDKKNFSFYDDFKYFNLQEHDKESVAEALYSLGEEIPKDPLYRDSSKINKLYDDGFMEIVRKHNYSCLKSESIIFLKRFVKKNIMKNSTRKFKLK